MWARRRIQQNSSFERPVQLLAVDDFALSAW
jgi:hypothetical protein